MNDLKLKRINRLNSSLKKELNSRSFSTKKSLKKIYKRKSKHKDM